MRASGKQTAIMSSKFYHCCCCSGDGTHRSNNLLTLNSGCQRRLRFVEVCTEVCPSSVVPDSLRLGDCGESNSVLLCFYCFKVIYPPRTIDSINESTVEGGYPLSNLSIRMFSKQLPVPLVCQLLTLGADDEPSTSEVVDK